MRNDVIVVDSSAVIALMTKTDDFHQKAFSISEKIKTTNQQIILPYEIFTETITTVSKKIGRQEGVIAGERILSWVSSGNLLFSVTNASLLTKALVHLKTAKGVRGAPSFFDCLVMAFADHYQTPYIFGFDEVFAKNGYTLPDAVKEKV